MKKTSRAGVSDTRAGLQPAGLFSNAGIFKKGFQDFHPLDESPYLLFDAESSMLGNLENPSLDLDASKAETLDVITATRAGIATFTAADGQIVVADENTVRVDWSLGYPAMLIEPSATNEILYSEDFSNAGWSKIYGVVVTPTNEEAPDGTTNAFNLSEIEGTDGDLGLSEFLTITPSATYTFSAYFKAAKDNDIGKKVRIRIKRNSGTAVASSQAVVLTSDWVRHSVTITYFADNTDAWHAITKDTSSPIEQRADECLIWGAQVETGSVATSYIPTSGSAVTRNADQLVVSGSDFTDFYNATEGTIYTEAVGRGYFNQNTNFSICLNNNFSNSIYQRSPSNTQTLVVINGGSVQAHMYSATASTGTLVRRAVSFKLNNFKASQDGVDITPDTSGTMPTVDRFYIGASTLGDRQLNGHIKRLIYWPTHSDNL